MSDSNGSLRSEGYHIERLDDVLTRVARIEGKLESFATKEDVANAKYAMLIAWVGISVAVLTAIVSIALRFWPG